MPVSIPVRLHGVRILVTDPQHARRPAERPRDVSHDEVWTARGARDVLAEANNIWRPYDIQFVEQSWTQHAERLGADAVQQSLPDVARSYEGRDGAIDISFFEVHSAIGGEAPRGLPTGGHCYIVLQSDPGPSLAHELGHVLGARHNDRADNLMYRIGGTGGRLLNEEQLRQVHGSDLYRRWAGTPGSGAVPATSPMPSSERRGSLLAPAIDATGALASRTIDAETMELPSFAGSRALQGRGISPSSPVRLPGPQGRIA
jgi:hypothetical protein